jgi:RHS repeat-associated protein
LCYDAFGNKTYYVNTAGTFGWNAKSQYQTDSSSGLMLLGNRYFDATTGRFISQDPAQDESNWYSYCGNNPLVAVDPSGLATKPSDAKKLAEEIKKLRDLVDKRRQELAKDLKDLTSVNMRLTPYQ